MSITVTQDGNGISPSLSVSPTSSSVPSSAGTTTFAVSNTGTGTMAWEAEVTSGTWLTITSGGSGSNTGTISCAFDTNTTTSLRTGTITVTATGANGSPKAITVTQAGGGTGSLTVSLSPAEAITAGAMWRVDAGTWQSSGATVSGLNVGTHTVDFKDVACWTKPSSKPVTIQNGVNSKLTETYVESCGQSFVTRNLPDSYMPGFKLSVTLTATPASGVYSYTVSDSPPQGWAVSAMNEGGAFDSALNKVKFGPFFDNKTRTLTYDVTPPSDEIDKVSFSGTASADGSSSTIGGESELSSGLNHPADKTPLDFAISDDEVTAYGAAWKKGTAWSSPPNTIPDDYVTRAGYLWRNGEKYDYIPSALPPMCWIKHVVARASEKSIDVRSAELSSAVCDMPTTYYPGTTLTVTITVAPSTDISAYTVSDTVPQGWNVSAINESGNFDVANNKIKYGPFFDNKARTLMDL